MKIQMISVKLNYSDDSYKNQRVYNIAGRINIHIFITQMMATVTRYSIS